MTRETQLPLPAAFFSVPLPLSLLYFFSFCTFSHSAHFQSFLLSALFSISTFVHFHLWVPLPCCLSRLFVVSVMSSPFSCVALHQLKLQILRTSLTDFPLLSVCLSVCAFVFHSSLHSPPPPCLLCVVTSSGAPSLLPTPIVLSQLGCGLDGSGPPLPSPRLHQQHQPQIQVIQQL